MNELHNTGVVASLIHELLTTIEELVRKGLIIRMVLFLGRDVVRSGWLLISVGGLISRSG